MKKFLLASIAAFFLFLIPQPAAAVEDPDNAGTIIAGIHFGPDFVVGMSSGLTLGPAIYLTGDYVLVDSWWIGHLTAGAALGGTYVGPINMSSGVETRSNYFIAARSTYGINFTDRLEFHIGLVAGPYLHYDQVVNNDGSLKYANPRCIQFELGGIFGSRFSINDRLGLSAEFNTAEFQPLLSLGVFYKL